MDQMMYSKLSYIKKTKKKFNINSLCWTGIFIRVICLMLIYIFADSLGTNYIVDDVKFETFAKLYSTTAQSIIDVNAFNSSGLGVGGISTSYFWFWFVGTVTYVTKSVWVIRLINVTISAVTTKLVYRLTANIADEESAKLSAKLFVFMPYSVLTSCFIIKDHFVMFGFMYLVLQISDFRRNGKLKIKSILLATCSLIMIYFTRSGLAEILLAIFLVYTIIVLHERKRYISVTLYVGMFLIIAGYLVPPFVSVLGGKMDVYLSYGRTETTIAIIRIDSIKQIYKLPLTYVFALFQPLYLRGSITSWSSMVGYLNISLIPIAIGNALYLVFGSKKDKLIYWSLIAIFLGSIILSLGVARHYYFMLPFSIVNFAIFYRGRTNFTNILYISGSFCLLIFLITYFGFVV